MQDDLSTEHVIVPFLTDEYLNTLFSGLDNPIAIFGVEEYWKNAEELSTIMAEDMAEHYRYSDELNVIGDLGEMFVGCTLEEFPTAFQIKPGSVRFCEPNQKGYDIEAFNVIDGCLMRIQVKFYCPYRLFGEGAVEERSKAIHKLDSFVASTVADGEVYRKKHRLLITTAEGINYEICEIGDFQAKMRIFARADLKHIIQGSSSATSAFWYRFRDKLSTDIHTVIPLPSPPTPYQEQLEDIAEIKAELVSGNATLISTVGTGKTVVGLAVATEMLKD